MNTIGSSLLLLLAFAGADDPAPKPPAGKDGLVDYEKLLNDRLSKGITPETNANVLIVKALGPKPDGVPLPAEYFKRLGIDPLENCVVTVHLGYTQWRLSVLARWRSVPARELAQRPRPPYRTKPRGHPRSKRRLVSGQPRARRVEALLARHPRLAEKPWTLFRLDDRDKGPSVWEVKHVHFWPTSEDGLPGAAGTS